MFVGAWRSLVARTLGVREVAGSNPAAPTIFSTATKPNSYHALISFFVRRILNFEIDTT